MNGQEKRTYVKVTEDIEAAVLAARVHLGETASYAEVGRKVGVPERTVKYVLTDLPRLRRTARPEAQVQGSLKQRIVATLQVLGEVQTIRELSHILGRADSDHDIVHVLHSLHTQGKVDFKESGPNDAPTSIHLTKRGATKPTTPDVHDFPPVEDNPTPPLPWANNSYPLFEALLAREGERIANDAKAMAYVEAAEAIEKVDPDLHASLMAKADALSAPYPSPIEREFLDYVAAHPYTPYVKP
jgi:alkylated DNA nucleotide flippase Atl1